MHLQKIRNEPAVGWIPRAERGKKGLTPDCPPSSRRREDFAGGERVSLSSTKNPVSTDLFDPAKLTLIARRLLRDTLLSRTPLNRRLIDFSLFRCFFFSKFHPF